MKVDLAPAARWSVEPPQLGGSGLLLLLGAVAVLFTVLVLSTTAPADSIRECALAADVAKAVGGGPFFRDLEGEIIGQPRLDDSPWKAHCLSTFRSRGFEVLPPRADLFSSKRLGTRFSRPFFFFNSDYASIDVEPYGGREHGLRLSVVRQDGHWVIVRSVTQDTWPPRF